jgi:hypothetical protein
MTLLISIVYTSADNGVGNGERNESYAVRATFYLEIEC